MVYGIYNSIPFFLCLENIIYEKKYKKCEVVWINDGSLSTQDSSCWLSRSRRVSCRRSNEGNLGRSRSHCGSYFTFCATRHSSYWPSKYTCKTSLVFFLHIIDSYLYGSVYFGSDVCYILSQTEEPAFRAWSRIIGVPTFCTRRDTLWFFGFFIYICYLKFGKNIDREEYHTLQSPFTRFLK